MGEEFGCRQPFLYFADFKGELAQAVRDGRKREFASFERFGGTGAELPDAISIDAFRRSVLRWDRVSEPEHAEWLEFYRELLELRRRFVVPGLPASTVSRKDLDGRGLLIDWQMKDGSRLTLLANLSEEPLMAGAAAMPEGRVLHAEPVHAAPGGPPGELAPWSAIWRIEA
jgi:1,4-alpha-glucan branching enzyme